MAFLGDSMSSVEMKQEVCLEDELKDAQNGRCFVVNSLVYPSEDDSSTIASEYSTHQAPNFKQVDVLQVSSFSIVAHTYVFFVKYIFTYSI